MIKARALLLLIVPSVVVFGDSAIYGPQTPLSLPTFTGLAFVLPVFLLLRNRFPLSVFLLTLPALFAEAYLAPLIAAYAVAVRHSSSTVLGACALLYTLVDGLALGSNSHDVYDLTTILPGLPYRMAPIVGVLALGMLIRTRQELSLRLVELAEAHEREKELQADRILAEERARLAREMHDVIAHHVSLISVRAGALQVTTTDPRTRDAARGMRELAAHTLDQLRRMLGIIRATDGAAPVPARSALLSDIPGLLSDSRLAPTARFDVSLTAPPAAWTEPVQHAVFRTVQEALTNIRKHAPGAHVHLHLHEHGQHLHVDIHNGPPDTDARPVQLPGSGLGLTGLRERAHLLGGSLLAQPLPDGGFRLQAAFPRHCPPPSSAEPPRQVAGAPATLRRMVRQRDSGQPERGAGSRDRNGGTAEPHREARAI